MAPAHRNLADRALPGAGEEEQLDIEGEAVDPLDLGQARPRSPSKSLKPHWVSRPPAPQELYREIEGPTHEVAVFGLWLLMPPRSRALDPMATPPGKDAASASISEMGVARSASQSRMSSPRAAEKPVLAAAPLPRLVS